MRENLVVVRAGDKSLHPQWLDPRRNWDIAVSYFGGYPERYKDQFDYLHNFKGSKWQGLDDFVKNNSSLGSKYRYVWFPDDDLLSNYETINKFFNICFTYNLTLAQPALTEYSYYTWKITLRKHGIDIRVTDFVEIMAPCFRVSSFDKFADTFCENSSGFGLECLWKKIAIDNNIFKFGIVDAAPVHHTRKVGSQGHGGSVSVPHMELLELLKKYNLSVTTPVTLQEILIK